MDKFLDCLDKIFEGLCTFFKYSIPGCIGAVLSVIISLFTFGLSGSLSEILLQIAISAVLGAGLLILLTYLFPKTVGVLFGIASEVEVNQE